MRSAKEVGGKKRTKLRHDEATDVPLRGELVPFGVTAMGEPGESAMDCFRAVAAVYAEHEMHFDVSLWLARLARIAVRHGTAMEAAWSKAASSSHHSAAFASFSLVQDEFEVEAM